MNEYIDILTKEGEFTGKSTLKSIIHQKGYYHNTAHIWFYTKDEKILLSQRSAKKTICPLLWDVSVAGHVDAGETIQNAAIRETFEEIGLTITKNELYSIGVFECFQTYQNGIIDNEFHHTFISELKLPLSKLTRQEEEVEALKLISTNDFKQLIEDINIIDNYFIPSSKAYYQFVLNSILNKFKPT